MTVATHVRLRHLVATAVAAGALFVTGGCQLPMTRPPEAPAEPVVRTVSAEERTIASVLTLDAVVVVNPFIRIAAPSSGTLVTLDKGRVGIAADPGARAVPLELPAGTAIVSLLAKPDTKVTAGLPILNARYTGFAMQAVVPTELAYRLYDGVLSAKAQVHPGPGPFEVTVLGVPYPPGSISLSGGSDGAAFPTHASRGPGWPRLLFCDATPELESPRGPQSVGASSFPVVASSPGDGSGGLIVIAPLPAGMRSLEGLQGRLALVTGESTGVALPLEAVAGVVGKGEVYVVRNGEAVKTSVTLGITDGSYVEVLSGVRAGDLVQIPSPSMIAIVR